MRAWPATAEHIWRGMYCFRKEEENLKKAFIYPRMGNFFVSAASEGEVLAHQSRLHRATQSPECTEHYRRKMGQSHQKNRRRC